MQNLVGFMFENQLYEHAGKALRYISLTYENLKFAPLDSGPLRLESYLNSTVSVSWNHVLGKDNNFEWLRDYQHANFKGNLVKLETFNFNLVTTPLYNVDGKYGPHIVIGEVKAEGSIHHLAKGLLQCGQLAGLIMENVRQLQIRHHDLVDEPRLKISFFLFVICGYFEGFPNELKGKVTKNNLRSIAGWLKLEPKYINYREIDEVGVSNLWQSFVSSTYNSKTIKEMYAEDLPRYDIINSFTLLLLLRFFLEWEEWGHPHGPQIDIGFIQGRL